MHEQYDPWLDLASKPDIRLVWRHQHRCGEYHHADREIRLRHGLSESKGRSVLAHELVHAERGDVELSERALNARQELLVTREAARRLIGLQALADAVRWTCHPGEVADVLRVDVSTLRARLECLTDEERTVLDRASEEHAA